MKLDVDQIITRRGFISGTGVSDEIIERAEEKLGIRFSQDYSEYLRKFGMIAYSGHELTGLSDSDRLDVVEVTMYEWRNTSKELKDCYVIEQTNIDGIVIWQSESGCVFRTDWGTNKRLISATLTEYILTI